MTNSNSPIETYDDFIALETAIFDRQKQIMETQKDNKNYAGSKDLTKIELHEINQDLVHAYDKDLNKKRALLLASYVRLCKNDGFPDIEKELEAEEFVYRQAELVAQAALNKDYITAKNDINLSDLFIQQSKTLFELLHNKKENYGDMPLSAVFAMMKD